MCRRAEFGVLPSTDGFTKCIPVHVAFAPTKPNYAASPSNGCPARLVADAQEAARLPLRVAS